MVESTCAMDDLEKAAAELAALFSMGFDKGLFSSGCVHCSHGWIKVRDR